MSAKKKGRLLQHAEYALYRVISGAMRALPETRVAKWGGLFGAFAGKILRRRDRLAFRNLRETYPDKSAAECRRILDECWRHFGRQMLIYIRIQQLPLQAVLERCTIVDAHHFENARAMGKGVILVSAHLGSWEIGGLVIMSLTRDVRAVTRALDNEFLERDLQRIRERTGAEVIDRRHAARPLLKALAENAVVALLPDQAVLPREGVLVPFLGRPAWTTPAPAKLALRQGAPIVFAFCIPDGTRHRLEFEEAILVDRLNEGERDPVALTRRINDVISARIAAHPDLWLWMHDRWKGTGESETPDAQ